MIRCWVLAILLAVVSCHVAEAQSRNRVIRYHNGTYRSQPMVYRSVGSSQVVYPQGAPVRMQQPVQSMSYPNSSGPVASGSVPYRDPQMQAWAEEEARMMAARGTCGHIRGAPPGYFVGVGCGMTCMGSGRLVAEASYQGKMVRVWKM